jgi:hypothetical protein
VTHVARRRLIVSVVGLVAVAAGVFLMRGCAWPTNNALIGQTEEVVRARYGVPEYGRGPLRKSAAHIYAAVQG